MVAARPKVVILGSSFAGLTTARYLRQLAGDAINLVGVDRNPYMTFVPNISMEVFGLFGYPWGTPVSALWWQGSKERRGCGALRSAMLTSVRVPAKASKIDIC